MPVLEITQAGINSISSFDPFGNSPTGNFGYCNVYNVDPTTFDKAAFKAFTTVSQQQAYLASTSTGARNGYATPPIFPYQGNADALVRVGNSGSTVLNQPALRVNKVAPDQVKYLHQIITGIGDFYFNLLVIYNTIGTLEANRINAKDMPIAFIYLFDGMQRKSEDNVIEMDTTIQYSGVAATIEYIINPTVTASLLEVSLPDFLPVPSNASSNIYLIKDPSPVLSSKHPTSIATLSIEDTSYGNNINLWQFDTHHSFIETTIISNANNTVTRSNLGNFTFAISTTSNTGFIMQVTSGAYVGQCRRIADVNVALSYITWGTAFGNVIPAGTSVRIYIPNKLLLETPTTPSQNQVDYRHSLRATSPFTHGYNYVYDGNGSTLLQTWVDSSLNSVNGIPNSTWLVPSSKFGVPGGFTGLGILTLHTDNTSNQCRQVLRQLGTNSYTWERNITISTSTPTDWRLTSDEIASVTNVSELPTFDSTPSTEPIIRKYIVSRTSSSQSVAGGMDTYSNSIFVTKSSNSFDNVNNHYWSFSTHSQFVCSGVINNLGTDMGSYRDIVLAVTSGPSSTNWNTDTTLPGDPNARFIIQFYESTGSILPFYTGMTRGFGVADVVGLNTVRLRPSLPTLTSGSIGTTNIYFIIYESNTDYINKAVKDTALVSDFFDNTTGTPNNTNQWGYTDAMGIIHKGGLINILDSGTTVNYNTPFPNKCLFTSFQPFGTNSTGQSHLEDTPEQNPTFFKAVSDGGARISYWYSKGR